MPFDAEKNAERQRKPDHWARIARTQGAVTLMIVAALWSLIFFIESIEALEGISGWYPQLIVQQWFVYDELFTVFSFLGLLFGVVAATLILSGRSSTGAVLSATACTLSGAGVFVVSLVSPLAVLWQSVVYYFLPLFVIPLAGTLLAYVRIEEGEQPERESQVKSNQR